MLLAQATMTDIRSLREVLERRLANSASLQSASDAFLTSFREQFAETVVLARVYATLPLSKVPARDAAFARTVASAWGIPEIPEKSLVLSLMGTRGARPGWNDRHRSAGHLALPLTSRKAVESAPMIASLMSQIGVELQWFDMPHDAFSRKLVGGFNGNFYVPDALTTKDAQGRHIIPAQDFVREHAIRSVFGMGGAYLSGQMTVAAIFFTTELLDPSIVNQFATLASTFKGLTSRVVLSGRLFES